MDQISIFGCSCILGGALGVIYDIFRAIRIMINPRNIAIFVQDIIYFLICGFITFAFVLVFNFGQSRFYILVGESIGWILYHITLGDMIYKKIKNHKSRE